MLIQRFRAVWEKEVGSKERADSELNQISLKRERGLSSASLPTACARAFCAQLVSTASALGQGLKIKGRPEGTPPPPPRTFPAKREAGHGAQPKRQCQEDTFPGGTRGSNAPQKLKKSVCVCGGGTSKVSSSFIPCQLEAQPLPGFGTEGTARQAPRSPASGDSLHRQGLLGAR